jgi:hypothetical protein
MDHISSGDRASGVLQLSSYGEDAIPIILGEIKTVPSHIDWPQNSLAAINALKRIGISKLRDADREYLMTQAVSALTRSGRGPRLLKTKEKNGWRYCVAEALRRHSDTRGN